MAQIDTIILVAFGIAFFFGFCLAVIGAWWLWQKMKVKKEEESVKR